MITLGTGLPRSGKTHSRVAWLLELQEYWQTEEGSRDFRTVYSNIKGLQLPHLPLPIADEVYNADGVLVSYSVAWSQVVQGSLVIIDECQDTFPPRTTGKAPAHVAYLNTHGHQGLDIVCITQHPKLIDNNVRRLVNKHLHYRKNSLKIKWLWFVPDAVSYEWDHCEDGLQGLKNAVMGSYSYTKAVNEMYVSAAEHRTPTFSRPWWIWVPVVFLPFGVWAGVEAGSRIKSMLIDKDAFFNKAKASPKKDEPSTFRPAGALPPVSLPSPAPAPAEPSEGPDEAPAVVAGCVRVRDVCRCYTATAQVVPRPEAFCRANTTYEVVKASEAVLGGVPDLAPPSIPPDLDMIAWSAKRR